MTVALKKLAASGLAALTLAGAVSVSSTPASAQWCRWHNCGYHRGYGAAPLIGGLVAGAIIGGAVAAHRGSCWRRDAYGRAYRVC